MSELSNYRDIGLDALQYFHNESLLNFGDKYKITFDQLVNILSTRPNQKNFVTMFGGAIYNTQMADYKVASAMEELSEITRGKLPDNNSAFIQALSDEMTNIHLVEALGATAIETIKDIGTGAEKIGNTVLSVSGTLLDMSKWVIPLGVLAYVYLTIKKQA